jgi:hypothetical protein
MNVPPGIQTIPGGDVGALFNQRVAANEAINAAAPTAMSRALERILFEKRAGKRAMRLVGFT